MRGRQLLLLQRESVNVNPSRVAKQHRQVFRVQSHPNPIQPREMKSLQIDDALRFASRWADSKHALITALTQEVNEAAISRPGGIVKLTFCSTDHRSVSNSKTARSDGLSEVPARNRPLGDQRGEYLPTDPGTVVT